MKLKKKYILWAIVIICLLVIFGTAKHSVDEIHYLKRFYPAEFSSRGGLLRQQGRTYKSNDYRHTRLSY